MKKNFIAWDSRKKGFTPDMFQNVQVVKDPDEKYGWRIYSEGKKKEIRTPKEWSSKEQHYYAYVRMDVGNNYMIGRSMSLAALIWLCYLGRSIPAGCIIDHKDENPANNEPSNLQLLSVGDNVKKHWKLKKK